MEKLHDVPLSDLCWVVSQQTGIPHEVANPATGDLTVSVSGTLAVGELRQALAEVLGVAWKPAGSGAGPRFVADLTPARAAEEARLLDDLIEMASLTPYQIGGLSDVIPGLAERAYANQDLLLFWKDLPPSQRHAAAGGTLTLRDVPLALHTRARQLVVSALGSGAPLVLSNATLQVEQSPGAFTLRVRSLEKTPGERTVDLTCPRSLVQALQRERQARLDALRAASIPVRSRASANS